MIGRDFMDSRNARFAVCRRRSLRLCSASVVGFLLLSACDGTASDSSSDILFQGDPAQNLLSRLWADIRPDADIRLPPIRFPADLSPHPDAGSESFQLQAVLMRADGSMMSVQAQLDRLALGIEKYAASKWGFSDIMRSSVAVGVPDQPALMAREIVERQALELANSDPNSIYVIDTQLNLQLQSDDQAALLSSDDCRVRYQFSAALARAPDNIGDALSLTFAMPACPETLALQGLNRWQASALAATATLGRTSTLTASSDETYWQGHVWLSQTWGNVPLAQGAVLIDQVNLRLTQDTEAGAQLVSASRSKRKSGRGPQTVLGTISGVVDGEQGLDLQWTDEGEQVSPITGIIYPQRFRLRSRDELMDLLLTPVVNLPEIRDSLGIRWNGAVTVSGTHSGVGFLNFQPLRSDGQS